MGLRRPKLTNLDPFFLQNVHVRMDSGHDIFFGRHFHFFGPPNRPFFGGMVTLPDLRFHFAKFEVLPPTRSPSASWWPVSLLLQRDITLPDLRFCLIEPQIWQSGRVVKSSGQRLPDLRFCLDGTSNLAKWPPGLRGSKESTFFGG